MEDLLPDFLTETLESLSELDTEVVRLEREPGHAPTLSSIFRRVHTIKGTCGFLGLPRLEAVAHAAESLLGRYRDGTLAVTPGSVTLILQALDSMRAILEGIRAAGQEPAGGDAALIAALTLAAGGLDAQAPGAAGPQVVAEPAHVDAPDAGMLDSGIPDFGTPDSGMQTIRVNVDVLEGLMTLVSELVLTRNQLLQLARTRYDDVLAAPLQRLSHITSDLQDGVLKTRMQPIGNAWNTLPRLVRTLAHELGKEIDFVMLGAATELDRQVLELIKDPLTHMIRNSADHGLEPTAERRLAGKPDHGRIQLNAFHEGGRIAIEVRDDGRGLPVQRIRSRILSRGLATEAEVAAMADQRLQSFIFHPGFSTASAVTAVSGRGVGLDVVKTNIERIGGTIDLDSVEGRGTLFTIRIPLTLAIVPGLIIGVRGQRFVIPQISVVELVRAQALKPPPGRAVSDRRQRERPAIKRINDTPVLKLRDQLLPLVNLSDLLGIGPPGWPDAVVGAASTSLDVVVAQAGTHRFGLVVSRIVDTEEIVVKPVASILRHIPLFSGNTILGDGSVVMILDANAIARAAGIGVGTVAREVEPVPQPAAETSLQRVPLLLFKAGGIQPMAVPLGLVAQLKAIDRQSIECLDGRPMVQHGGRLMPLLALPDGSTLGGPAEPGTQPVMVFADNGRTMGLMVDQVVDVVEEQLQVQLTAEQPGFLGTAIVQGRATAILDVGFWLKRAFKDWFEANRTARIVPARVLVVEDSPFFRSLILPALSAEGYEVTAVEQPMAALALREAGRLFDLILSDIEMPGMDGLAFVRDVRAGGPWARLPVLALTSKTAAGCAAEGQQAGFDGYLSKFDKSVLLAAVAAALRPSPDGHAPDPVLAGQEAAE